MSNDTPSVRRARARLIVRCAAAVCGALCAFAAAAADGDVLRVLKLTRHDAAHPHRDTADEFRIISDFARRTGRTLEWVDAHHPDELHARLVRGEADLLVSDLPPSLAADPRLDHTVAIGTQRRYLVARDDVHADSPAALAGHRVAVRLTSPLWPYLNRLAETLDGLDVVVMPAQTPREALLEGAANGHWDAAVIAVRPGEDPGAGRPRLTASFALTGTEPTVWYVRQDRQHLRRDVDGYLRRFHASYLAPPVAEGDLEEIRRRGVLRVITRVDPQNYFLRRGNPAGFELELVQRFARSQGLALEFLVGESDRQILGWLRRGAGDLVTTRVNGEAVRNDPALARSVSYFHSASVVVGRRGSGIDDVHSLAGRRVAVHANSVGHRALGALVAAGTPIVPVVINPDVTLDDVLARIENWAVDAAIVDAHALKAALPGRPLIVAGASLPAAFDYAWVTRARNDELGGAVDAFLRDVFRRETYNVLTERYFGRDRYAQFATLEHLSPYDELVRRHAETHDFDWRLIVAQMYHESRFDPRAVSYAGASGLMQLLPGTAAAMGVGDPFDPEAGISGGIRYLGRLRDRFDAAIAPRERTWFALAAYNVGYHRVQLARRRAQAAGLDANRWFGHVEQAMRSMTRDGTPCRCGQTIAYVRAIRSLYNTYHRLQDVLTAGLPLSPRRPTG